MHNIEDAKTKTKTKRSEAYCNLDSSYNNSKVLRSMPTEQPQQEQQIEEEDEEQMKLLIIHSHRCCI